jgi:hypothetical protein
MRLSIAYKDSPKWALLICFNKNAPHYFFSMWLQPYVMSPLFELSWRKPLKAQMGGSKLIIEYVFINPFPLYFFHPKA